MLELDRNKLKFTFPEIHPDAELEISFQRTVKVVGDSEHLPLRKFGSFPIFHVEDYADKVPLKWVRHGGVMLPMYQSEALWLDFKSNFIHAHGTPYPFAIKVATGKVNVVTGRQWKNELDAKTQDYLVIPDQSRLDGYCTGHKKVSQFVSMPLRAGYSVEEQLSGESAHGGFQIIVYPMLTDVFHEKFPRTKVTQERENARAQMQFSVEPINKPDMGVALGETLQQEIYEDKYGLSCWTQESSSRCFVHITNSIMWKAITETSPPLTPLTEQDYANLGLQWVENFNEDTPMLKATGVFDQIKSIFQFGNKRDG